jgi:hypothetical protein
MDTAEEAHRSEEPPHRVGGAPGGDDYKATACRVSLQTPDIARPLANVAEHGFLHLVDHRLIERFLHSGVLSRGTYRAQRSLAMPTA